MKDNEQTLSDLAAHSDDMFVWHLLGALKVHDPEFLETTSREYLRVFYPHLLEMFEKTLATATK